MTNDQIVEAVQRIINYSTGLGVDEHRILGAAIKAIRTSNTVLDEALPNLSTLADLLTVLVDPGKYKAALAQLTEQVKSVKELRETTVAAAADFDAKYRKYGPEIAAAKAAHERALAGEREIFEKKVQEVQRGLTAREAAILEREQQTRQAADEVAAPPPRRAPIMDNQMNGDEPDEAGVEQPGAPPSPATEAAFRIALDFIAVAADPREARKRLKGYYGALTAVDAAQKNLVAASSEFEAFRSKAADDLAAREQAVRGREVKVSVAEEGLREREADLSRRYAEHQRADTILKRRVMLLARLDAPGPLQSTPSWKQISAELFNAEQLDLADEAEAVTEQPAGLPENVTLTRTFHKRRQSARRVEAS
jgi:hypothetical protein